MEALREVPEEIEVGQCIFYRGMTTVQIPERTISHCSVSFMHDRFLLVHQIFNTLIHKG